MSVDLNYNTANKIAIAPMANTNHSPFVNIAPPHSTMMSEHNDTSTEHYNNHIMKHLHGVEHGALDTEMSHSHTLHTPFYAVPSNNNFLHPNAHGAIQTEIPELHTPSHAMPTSMPSNNNVHNIKFPKEGMKISGDEMRQAIYQMKQDIQNNNLKF